VVRRFRQRIHRQKCPYYGGNGGSVQAKFRFYQTELNNIALKDFDPGIELQSCAVKLAKSRQHIDIIQGSAFDLPFKIEEFDLVFTSEVLIRLHPDDVRRAMAKIHRCTKKYIWGLEHYADDYGNYLPWATKSVVEFRLRKPPP
jgi:hypothetical protein